MSWRGGVRFTHEAFKEHLGLIGDIYAIELDPHTASITVWAHNAQDASRVNEGEHAPTVRAEMSVNGR